MPGIEKSPAEDSASRGGMRVNDFLRRFKKIVAQVSNETGVRFQRHGLNDLLRDAIYQ